MAAVETIKAAREDIYRSVHPDWRAAIHPDHRRGRGEPTGADVARVRAAVLHGYTVEAHVAGLFAPAVAGLRPMLTRAADPRLSEAERDVMVDDWRDRHTRRIAAGLRTLIVSSATHADIMAARDQIDPALLHSEAMT